MQHTDDLWTCIYLSELAEPPPSQGCTGNSQVIPSPFGTGHPRWDLLRSHLPFSDVSCSSATQVVKCVTPACNSRLSTLHIHIEDVFLHLNKVPVRSQVSSCHNSRKLQYYLCQTTVTAIPSHGLRPVYLQMITGFEGRKKLIITDMITYWCTRKVFAIVTSYRILYIQLYPHISDLLCPQCFGGCWLKALCLHSMIPIRCFARLQLYGNLFAY